MYMTINLFFGHCDIIALFRGYRIVTLQSDKIYKLYKYNLTYEKGQKHLSCV